MKKLILRINIILLFSLFSLILTSCNIVKVMFTTEVESFENEITLSCDANIRDYLPYEEVPNFTFTFDGKINITKNRQGEFECIFYGNDDFFISRLVKSLINEYQEKGEDRVKTTLTKSEKDAEVWMNRRDGDIDEKVYLKVKDEAVYNEISYILLDNGLILSINYARFIDSDNVTYYKWQTSESIRMVLHYPFMITTDTTKVRNKINSSKSFAFLPLPLGVTYKFDTTTKRLSKLLEDDKFLESDYYTYKYVNDYETDYENYKDYYIKYFNGRMIDDNFVITHFGIDFKIEFNNDNFVISLW